MNELDFCPKCGKKLSERELPMEGKVKYCKACKEFHFPIFSIAVSLLVLSPDEKEILLIKQYHQDRYILVAGYVNKGEDVEDALLRELKEETGLQSERFFFNHSHYFKKSETLMLNFTLIAKDKNVSPDWEIDSYRWFPFKEAVEQIAPDSLAKEFLLGYLNKDYHFKD